MQDLDLHACKTLELLKDFIYRDYLSIDSKKKGLSNLNRELDFLINHATDEYFDDYDVIENNCLSLKQLQNIKF